MPSLECIRKATPDDARQIAELVMMSSGGVAKIDWEREVHNHKNKALLDIGTNLYHDSKGIYSYRNCTIIEQDGNVAGMMLTFAIPNGAPRDPACRPKADDPDVYAPYHYLEEPDSWYVCGVSVFPEFRGRGLGTRLMKLAEKQARIRDFETLSLVVFEQNEASVRLYQRLGYQVVDWAPVVPHPLIRYQGNALLMIRKLDHDDTFESIRSAKSSTACQSV